MSQNKQCKQLFDNTSNNTAHQTKVHLDCRWGAASVPVVLAPADWATLTLGELKRRLDAELDVPHEKMRLMGVSTASGQPPREEDLLCDLVFKKPGAFLLMGTARDCQLAVASRDAAPDPGTVIRTGMHLERLRAAMATEITVLNPPRKDSRLLVLDLDYTVFDCKSSAPIERCKRPIIIYMNYYYHH